MKATNWEFTNRALVFGLILGLSFSLLSFGHENSIAVLSNWVGATWNISPDLLAHTFFLLAALLLASAAFLRTWASSYLTATVVYASQVKSDDLVADGPYRRVRNPLYLANVMMAISLGTMMSRSGFFFAVAAMLLFCYRLILREESELATSQRASYDAYCRAVPRLWPSLHPRAAAAGKQANWKAGLKAEFWYWGFAVALLAFAITFKIQFFFGVMTASILLFWLSSNILQKAR